MAPITFTADSTTDVITSVAHGLNTGDGPGAIINIGGGLPGGLTGGSTDYFFIRLTADTGKLATSNANALAGTAIDITTNGTGTQQLFIGLPYRRERTYAALSQVKSADINKLQDQAPSGGKRSLWTRRFFPKVLSPGPTTPWSQNTASVSGSVTVPVWQSNGSDTIIIEIPYDTGDRIVGLTYQAFGNGTTDVQSTVTYAATLNTAAGSVETLSTINDANRAATPFADVAMTSFVPKVLVEGSVLQLTILANGANYRIATISATYDRGA